METTDNVRNLQVGDEVCFIKRTGFMMKDTNFVFSKVVSLTKTQAILENGIRLKNEFLFDYIGGKKDIYFLQIGKDVYTPRWFLATPSIKEKAEQEVERKKRNNWFRTKVNKEFTDEEIKIVYDRFKELGLVE